MKPPRSCPICGGSEGDFYVFNLAKVRSDLAKRFVPVIWRDYKIERGAAHLECVLTEMRKVTPKTGSAKRAL